MTSFSRRLFTVLTCASLLASPVIVSPLAAQTVADNALPAAGLDIPANAQLMGNQPTNVYRPSATVNGQIITATDVEQRLALVRLANDGNLPDDQLPALRLQVFSTLIDEMLKIQEAAASRIEVTDTDVNEQFARVAASFRQAPAAFAAFLATRGASERALKQQIRGELAWQNLLARNIEPFTNVSEEEVRAIVERMTSSRGTEEFRVGEIYLSATPETLPAVAENARRILAQLSEGAQFPDFARRFSEASTASVGGDLGWVRLDQLPTTLAAATQRMQPGQLAGPIESPGGVSIIFLIDKRQVLTADSRDATLSLKQVSMTFPAGTTEAQATEMASRFATATRGIAGCGQAEAAAAMVGATVTSRDQIAMRDLPPQLQNALGAMQIGQVTPPFGSPGEGVSVLVLCGRDLPAQAAMPSTDDIAQRLREDRVNRRAARFLRDLRRDAVIEYS